jgi:hypothetical protein
LGPVPWKSRLAVCLLMGEWFGRRDAAPEAVDLLRDWLRRKHNGFVSRGVDHPDVLEQVARCVNSALRQTAESQEAFCRVRQNQAEGRYRRVIRIKPILRGDGCMDVGETPPSSFLPLDYMCNLQNPVLPASMESRIAQFITPKMRRRANGQYPVAEFSRPFLSTIWAQKGQARIPQKVLVTWSGNRKPNVQMQYKRLLVKAGLLKPGWERTYRSGTRAATYRLTDEAMAMFQAVSVKATG